jgi:hypothetical protein
LTGTAITLTQNFGTKSIPKEIYEGDIVEFLDGNRHEVTYDSMVASFMLTQRTTGATYSNGFDMIDAHEAEVIGDVYSSPHLLEQPI